MVAIKNVYKVLYVVLIFVIIYIGYRLSKPKRVEQMNGKYLNYVEVAPANKEKPKKLVIFLHGYGTNKDDLIGLASDFSDLLPDAQFISAEAPDKWEGGGFIGHSYQWFSFQSTNYFFIKPRIKKAREILDKFIDEQLVRFGLEDKDLLLIGFSQGAMMALYTGLQREEKIMGVISFSGALAFDEADLKKMVKTVPPILLIHGTADERMPYKYFEDAKRILQSDNIPFEQGVIEGMEHEMNGKAIDVARAFVKKLK